MRLLSVERIREAKDRCLIYGLVNSSVLKLANKQEISQEEMEQIESTLPGHLKGAYLNALGEFLTSK